MNQAQQINPEQDINAIEKYSMNLTQLARKSKIDPLIDLHKQIMVAAAAASFVLKYRKWYEEFHFKADQLSNDIELRQF